MSVQTDEALPPEVEAEIKRRRRGRSLAIAAVLVGLAVLFYIITLIQLGSNVAANGGAA